MVVGTLDRTYFQTPMKRHIPEPSLNWLSIMITSTSTSMYSLIFLQIGPLNDSEIVRPFPESSRPLRRTGNIPSAISLSQKDNNII